MDWMTFLALVAAVWLGGVLLILTALAVGLLVAKRALYAQGRHVGQHAKEHFDALRTASTGPHEEPLRAPPPK